ncbi:MAG: hypothetical protein E6H00_12875 [Bacillati bacterium ANGP1]|uniref:Transglycosylase SLT domain-containing protein n=1 Tax=Candidatus Segetimicrobium genomatis TaxID=2569760 RepID=A0A537JXU9_9BACT|nr:MAG: hypothetical protein E6H00_12875 [Terrabacteria group bacterium ANGP1]
MNASDIAALAQNAGFSGSDVGVAVAIALAESSGNPGAYNPEPLARGGTPPGQGSYGLWQIYLKMHPEFAGQNLYDPATNAAAAYRVYQSSGFRAWTTYRDGTYAQYLPAATQAPLTLDAATGQPIPDLTPTPPDVMTIAPARSQILVLTAAGIGLYLLADALAD